MSGHTPGPWWFGVADEPKRGRQLPGYRGPGFYDNPAIFSADGRIIVGNGEYDVFNRYLDVVDEYGHCEAEREANVRLLCAAPELLRAAQLYVAKVNSEYRDESDDWIYDSLGSEYAAAYFAARDAIAKATGQ